jgi:hypothetical protein
VPNLGALSYAATKPSSTGLVVELTGDGGVRVALAAWPRLWTRVWMTLLPWVVVLAFGGLLALLAWVPFRLPPGPIPTWTVVHWIVLMIKSTAMIVFGLAHSTICGVVIEIVARDQGLECTFARLFWRRRKRWPVATIKRVSVALELSDQNGRLWHRCLKLRRRGALAIRAFKGLPREELEWAASGLQDALSAAQAADAVSQDITATSGPADGSKGR